jgi:hypothetical protein
MTEPTATDDLLDEVEEIAVDESAETEEAPAKAKKEKAPAKPKIEYGAPWLADHVKEVTGQELDAKGVRMLLRKLNSEGKLGDREHGARYDFTGPEDPRVIAVVDAVKAKAAKASEPKAPRAKKGKAGEAASAEPVVEEEAEVEDLDELD